MKETPSESGRQFYIPIILTLITLILGMISFNAVFPDYPFSRNLYYTFQLFSMESGDRFYERGSQPLYVTIIFNFARFTAIAAIFATIILAILSVLKYKFYQMKLWRIKGHTIICGLGNMGKAIADNLRDKKKLVVIEKDNSGEYIDKLQNEGAIIIEANALDVSVLDKVHIDRARCLLALTGSDFDNLTIIKNALGVKGHYNTFEGHTSLVANIDSRNLKASVYEEWQKTNSSSDCLLNKNLTLYCETARRIQSGNSEGKNASDLMEDLKSMRARLLDYDTITGSIRNNIESVILFNKNQLAARHIFLNYPPDRFRNITSPDDRTMQILILGYSQIGEELLRLFAQNCHYINRKKTKITLISLDGDDAEERILSKYPTIRRIIDFCSIKQNPHHLTMHSLDKHEVSDVDVIYICSNEDRFQASYSSRARELFGNEIPIVRPFYQSTILSETEKANNTWSFNILSKISDLDYIVDRKPDRKAIAIHNHWLIAEISDYLKEVDRCLEIRKEIPAPKPTMKCWNHIPGEVRDDNRSVVDHINIKLRSFGQLTNPQDYNNPDKANINYSFLEDSAKVNQIAEMEHRRWMANKYLCGWEYGTPRDVKAKRHECMMDFDKLDPGIQDIDRRQVGNLKEIIELDQNL